MKTTKLSRLLRARYYKLLANWLFRLGSLLERGWSTLDDKHGEMLYGEFSR